MLQTKYVMNVRYIYSSCGIQGGTPQYPKSRFKEHADEAEPYALPFDRLHEGLQMNRQDSVPQNGRE